MLCFVSRWAEEPRKTESRQQGEPEKRRTQQTDYIVE